MKAFVQSRYGAIEQVLELQELDKPVITDNQVVVRVVAAGVNPLDWHFVTGKPAIGRLGMGFPKPKSQSRGVDVSGHIEAVGNGVNGLQPGDEVFGGADGSFAEFAAAPAEWIVRKPAQLTFEQAAAVPVAAITALQGLRDVAHVQAGQKVLINGAAGGVGTFAVQIAKSFGAEVTGVCSTGNVEMVRSIGADHVIDYRQADFTRGAQPYDLIFDNAGNHSMSELRRVLTPQGTLITNSGASLALIAQAHLLGRFTRQKLTSFLAKIKHDDLIVLCGLIESGKLKPVIDRTYPLSQTPEAIRYVEAGHARGKVVVTI